MASQINRSGIFILSLGLAMLGGWAAYQEASVYFTSGTTSISRLLALPATSNAPGLAPSTQSSTLADCHRAMQQPNAYEMRALPPEGKAALQQHCHDIAAAAVAERPTDAFAWVTGAAVAAAEQNWQDFNTFLRTAQAVAPSEQWIAEHRVDLAETHYDKLEPATRSGNDADLAMLVLSDRGIFSIAQRYLDQESFRERVTAILEQMPADRQRRFINSLNRRITLRQGLSAS
ncbi:hypothetical protein ASD04_00535 [Devosia sp. Root436]|uniref:hypothetical protein n=1 Tax=Devosia sp. Root436 TaxID=1736537 RepID=UPI00070034CB|nr:hypothetical protein [Devosia sp. Root436]KQX42495.1 hypothetical protein ASD04_00535 [Devosia sp. Root436]